MEILLEFLHVVAEVFPLLDLHLSQLVIHEDQHGDPAEELFRGHMHKFGALFGLAHSHHGKVGEGVHHRHALARFHTSVRRKEGGGRT